MILRDLARDPVPHLDAARFGSFLAKADERTLEQEAVIDKRAIKELGARELVAA